MAQEVAVSRALVPGVKGLERARITLAVGPHQGLVGARFLLGGQ